MRSDHHPPRTPPLLVEEGAALQALSRPGRLPTAEDLSLEGSGGREQPATRTTERCEVVVVGAGQSGLSVGHCLANRGFRFVILEASDRVGDVWRNRWDSLHLFSPARFDGLAGYPFPGPRTCFPSKDEMGDYLEAYARRFDLPVRTGTRVHRLARHGDRFRVETDTTEYEADAVVVAMATYQKPRVPEFAKELDPDIVQLHSLDYRNPSQLREGPVLVVGAGNSGAEIAKELAPRHRTLVSGRDTGELPFDIEGFWAHLIFTWLVLRVLFHRVLTVRTPLGRKARPTVRSTGGPLIRTKRRHLASLGVERVPRTVGASGGRPVLQDGRVLDVANVVWCTGFHPGFQWIDMPIFDERGEPRHCEGVAADVPGLYFVGLDFLYALSSTMVHGAARDAARVTDVIAARRAASHLAVADLSP